MNDKTINHQPIGKYPVLCEIGAGATSKVYFARDPFANRDVAIKVFLFDKHADARRSALRGWLVRSDRRSFWSTI